MWKTGSRATRIAVLAAAFGVVSAVPFGPSGVSAQGGQESCTWSATSEVIYYAMPDVVGECVSQEQANPQTGLIEQRTSHGMMLRRPADGATAFTDGTTLWLLGPDGTVNRSQGSQLPPAAR